MNKTNWPVTPKLVSDSHFFILVSYLNAFRNLEVVPEVFVIPSKEVHKVLSFWSGSDTVSCVGYSAVKNSIYKNAWHLLFKNMA